MCFLQFYADINSLRLSKNLQYNMIKSLSKACNLNRPTCISTATVGLGLYINLSFYRLYYLCIEEKCITQYIALKKLRKSDADDRGPAYLSYFFLYFFRLYVNNVNEQPENNIKLDQRVRTLKSLFLAILVRIYE